MQCRKPNERSARRFHRRTLTHLLGSHYEWYFFGDEGARFAGLTDLDLYVFDANGAPVGQSVSFTNNYEIVDIETSGRPAPFKIQVRYGGRYVLGGTSDFWGGDLDERFGLAVYDYALDQMGRPVE